MDWQELTRLTQGRSFVVERVRLVEEDVAIEGRFEPPDLARLSMEDQVFVAAFVRSHGSIKEMERIFGVSYPTIKNRLNRIADRLEFVDTAPDPEPPTSSPASEPESSRSQVLDRLRRGEIGVQDAVRELEALR